MTKKLSANVVNHFGITFLDYPDPENYAVQIFFCGCDFACTHCSNPELRDPLYSRGTHIYNVDEMVVKIEEVCSVNNTNHIVLIGGDACAKENRAFTKEFVKRMHKDYNICIYTGYTVDEIGWLGIDGFKFLKCGTFQKDYEQLSEKTEDYMQFASSNQVLYDGDLNQLSKDGKYYFNK